jgi:hypothetical protein
MNNKISYHSNPIRLHHKIFLILTVTQTEAFKNVLFLYVSNPIKIRNDSKDSPPDAMRIRYVEVPHVDLPRLVAKRQNPLLAVH